MAKNNEFGEEIQLEEKTFSQAEGLPANKHAKALAKKKSSKKDEPEKVAFYTLKGDKVIKMLVSLNGSYEVYIGNLKRHKDGLAEVMKIWKKDGLWVESHAVKEKIAEIRKKLAKK